MKASTYRKIKRGCVVASTILSGAASVIKLLESILNLF